MTTLQRAVTVTLITITRGLSLLQTLGQYLRDLAHLLLNKITTTVLHRLPGHFHSHIFLFFQVGVFMAGAEEYSGPSQF